MIFPSMGPTYYSEKHKEVLSRMEAFYAEAITTNLSFWTEADIDLRFFVGDQTVFNDMYYGNMAPNRKRQFSFNRINRIINTIEGHQRRNRKSTVFLPKENGDEQTADQLTKVMSWLEQKENYLETISDSFRGALVTGMNLLQVWVDYRNDPVSGNIKVDNCSYNTFLIDPFFKKADLSDCNSIWKRSFLTKRECISLMPDYQDEILGLYGNDTGTGRDGKFQFTPESYGYSYKNLLTYDEFYYRDFRTQKMLVDTQTGETMEWRTDDEEKLKLYLQTYPTVKVIEQDVPTVNLAIVIQGKVFYDGANPLGIDHYPFVPVFGYYTPECPYWPNRIRGIVRDLRDSQYLYNRRKVIELDIFESQINSGWIYKENALVNPKDVFLAGQGRGLALKEEAQMTDVLPIQPPRIDPSMLQVSEILGREIQEISGVSEELLGFDNAETKSGFHAALKMNYSVTGLQRLFDQLDSSQKLLGKIILQIVQTNFTPGKVKNILEEEPSQQFYSKNFGNYHVAAEEGLNTATQKQMAFLQKLHLREMGIPITDEDLIDSSTFQGKAQTIELMQQQKQQAMQMQQQQSQMQMQEIQSKIELAQARAEADRGLGLERASRVEENQALAVERRAAAVKDEESGMLDMVRALKELEGLDLEHLEKLVTLHHAIRDNESTISAKNLT